MRRAGVAALVAVLVLGAAVVVLRGGADGPGKVPGRPLPSPVTPLQEDDPGWDCATMGNRTCGPSLGVGP